MRRAKYPGMEPGSFLYAYQYYSPISLLSQGAFEVPDLIQKQSQKDRTSRLGKPRRFSFITYRPGLRQL